MTTKKQTAQTETVVISDLDALMGDMLSIGANVAVQYNEVTKIKFDEAKKAKDDATRDAALKEFDRYARQAQNGALNVVKAGQAMKTYSLNLRKVVLAETKAADSTKIAGYQETIKQLSAGGAGETKAAGVTPRARKPKTSDAPVAPETK